MWEIKHKHSYGGNMENVLSSQLYNDVSYTSDVQWCYLTI